MDAAKTDRPAPLGREAFVRFVAVSTRWSDNDPYGHINNAAYYLFFDAAVNAILVDAGLLDPANSAIIGLVAETNCVYF
jgi:acyl-CoA thioester hydrolase